MTKKEYEKYYIALTKFHSWIANTLFMHEYAWARNRVLEELEKCERESGIKEMKIGKIY